MIKCQFIVPVMADRGWVSPILVLQPGRQWRHIKLGYCCLYRSDYVIIMAADVLLTNRDQTIGNCSDDLNVTKVWGESYYVACIWRYIVNNLIKQIMFERGREVTNLLIYLLLVEECFRRDLALWHYNDVIMIWSRWRLKSPASRLFT